MSVAPHVIRILRLASLRLGSFDRMKRVSRGVNISLICFGFALWFGTQLLGQTARFQGSASNVNLGGLTLSNPLATAVDSRGNVYVADRVNNRVVELTKSGVASVLSMGSLTLAAPGDLAVDSAGDLFIADSGHNRVVEFSSGTASVVALGTPYANVQVSAVGADAAGDLYIGDGVNGKVLEVAVGASSATVVPVTGVALGGPGHIVVDTSGNLYISDFNSGHIVVVAPGGAASILSTGSIATPYPEQIAIDSNNNIYVADWYQSKIIEVPAAGDAFYVSTPGVTVREAYGVAVDSSGNLFIANSLANVLTEVQPNGVSLGSAALGATGTQTLTFTFTTGGTIGAPAVLTQGAAGLDFTDAGTGTCTTNGTVHTYAASDTCTVVVTFSPTAAGLRTGAATLLDGGGNPIATAYLYGTGTGPQLAFLPGTATATGTGTYAVKGDTAIAVDGAGNQYILDGESFGAVNTPSRILKIAANGTVTQVSTAPYTLSWVSEGLRVDGAGNLYVGDSRNSRVLKIQPNGTTTMVNTGSIALAQVGSLALDGSGNLYIGQVDIYGSNNQIVKVTPGGIVSTVPTPGVTISAGEGGLAVDPSGNIYFTDNSGNVYKVPPTGNVTAINASPYSFLLPNGLSTDATGNLYVANFDGNNILKVTPAGVVSKVNTGSYSLQAPNDVAVDASGNIYIADYGNSRALKVDVADAPGSNGVPSLVFGSQNDGTASAPQVVTAENIGNATLTFPLPSTGTDPSVATNFLLTNSTTCPQLTSSSSSAGTLTAGATCDLNIEFAPQSPAVGSVTGSVVLTDDDRNATPSTTQTIHMTGTAVSVPLALSPVVTVAFSPSTVTVEGSKTTTLTETIANPNATALTVISFSNTYPAGLVADQTGTYTCGTSGSTSSFTSSGFSFSNVTLAGGASCSVDVLMHATVIGSIVDTSSSVTTNESSPGSAASGTLTSTASDLYTAPVTPVGSTSPTQTVTVEFPTGANFTFNSASVVTQGATGLDFNTAPGGTCQAGHVYTAGNICTVDYAFAPKYPGLRLGAMLFSGTNAVGDNVTLSFYLRGTGTGPLATFSPGVMSVPNVGSPGGTALSGPEAVTVDGAGDLYIADKNNSRVVELSAAGVASVVNVGTPGGVGLMSPVGVTVDGAGSLYIADVGNHRIVEFTPEGVSSVLPVGAPGGTPLGSGFSVTVGGAGNLYIADIDNHRVVEYLPTGVSSVLNIGAPGGMPLGLDPNVAVDGAGNVYIVDYTNNRIVEYTASGVSSVLSTGTLSAPSGSFCPATALCEPLGVAVDAAGDIYIADSGNSRIVRRTAAGVVTELPLGSPGGAPLNIPVSVMLDGGGDLFIADNLNNRIVKLSQSTPPPLAFAATNVGAASSAQDVTVGNIGNTVLDLTALTPATDFNFSGADTTCTGSTALTAANTCVLGVVFVPLSGNPAFTESVSVTDNNLNVAGTVQPISVTGAGILTQASTTTTLTSNANPSVFGQSVTLTASVISGGSPVTGSTVTFKDGSATLQTAVVSGGMASITIANLATGSHSITAIFNSNASFLTSTSLPLNQTVNQDTTATSLPTSTLNPSSFGSSVTFNVTVAAIAPGSGSPTGTVTFSEGTTALSTQPVSSGAAAFSTNLLTAGQHTITATYNGDTNFSVSTSTQLMQVVTAGAANAGTLVLPPTAVAGATFSGTLTVKDSGGNVVPGVAISFNTTGLGVLTPGSPTTNSSGQIALSGVDDKAESITVTATASGHVIATASVQILSASISATRSIVVASPGTLSAGSTSTITVTLLDAYGNPLSGTSVSVTGNHTATVSGTPATTNSSGIVFFSGTDTIAESDSFSAASAGVPIGSAAVTFTVGTAANVAVVSGTPQSAAVNTGFAAPLVVKVTDSGGNAVPSATLIVTAPSTGASATFGTIPVTNSQGQASFVAEANSLSGSYNVIVSVAGGTTSATFALTNSQAAQTITFPPPPTPVTYSAGSTATLAATASSGLAVTYKVISGPAAVSGSTLTYTGGGTVVVEADQAGNPSYVAATPVQRTISVQVAPTITFTIPNHTSGDATFTVSANSNSPGALSYTLVTGNATVTTGGLVTLTGTGPVTVQAAQAASGFYLAGTQNASFTVSAATTTLAFAPIPTRTYGDAPFAVSATSASSGAVTYSVTSGPATIAGNVVTLTGSGTVVLGATQAAAGSYGPGITSTSFTVHPATPTLTFATIPTHTYGDAPFAVAATSASSGAATYSVTSGPATIAGNVVTLTGIGTVVLGANQAAAGSYGPGITSTSFTVNPATPTLTFATIPTHTYGDAAFAVSATSNSSGTITYSIVSGPASISGNVLNIAGVNSVTVQATVAAAGNYSSTSMTATFAVNPESTTDIVTASAANATPGQSVTFTATIQPVTAGSPTGSVTFYDNGVQLGSAVLLAGQQAALTTSQLAPGTHVITVSYSGDPDFFARTPAASTPATVVVTPLDFSLKATGAMTQDVLPGGAASFTYALSPTYNVYPGPVTFAISGLPPGASYTLSATSVASSAGAQNVTLTVQTASMVARNSMPGSTPRYVPFALALLLPLFGMRRLRRSGRKLSKVASLILLVCAPAVATFALSGCGTKGNGFFGQGQQTYAIDITATSGGVQHAATVNLQVE